MANLRVGLEINNQAYLRGINTANAATRQFGRDTQVSAAQAQTALERLDARTERLSASFGRLKGIIIGAAFTALASSAAKSADEIQKLSSATEFGISRIIEIQQSLQAAGGEASAAGKVISDFFRTVDAAASGSDRTQQSFARLSVSIRDLETLSLEELFDKTIKGFNNITDPAQRSALSIQMFGKGVEKVNLRDFNTSLEEMRGKFEQQRRSIEQTSEMVGNFDEAMDNLRLAFLTVTAPMVTFLNNLTRNQASLERLITLFKGLAIVIAAAFAFTGFGLIVRAIGTIGRGVGSLIGLFSSLGQTITRVFGANSTAMKILRGVGGLVAGIAGGVAAAMGLSGEKADIPEAEIPEMVITANRPRVRNVEAGKELAGQLSAIRSLAEGYRRITRDNIERMSIDMEILGLNRAQADQIKGTAEINKRFQEQSAELESRKKTAKGATLALINKEIANLEDLRTSELDIFNIQQDQTNQYARQQQEIKNIVELMEQQAEAAREIAEFQSQQDQAVLTAFQQVRAQREQLELTNQREQLEKSIQNLRGSDQAAARELFDLETQRLTQLEAIRRIQNLPFLGQGGMKQQLQEINDLYDLRRAKITETAEATRLEQKSFTEGFKQAGEKYRNNIKTDFEFAAQQLNTFTTGFENAFVRFVQTGKLSFRDLANSMIADFARIQAQKILTGFLSGGGGGGGFFGSIGKIFGFANGGMPPVGQPSLVGERGPELFVPQSAGRIVPNHKLGGSNTVVNNSTEVSYSISAVDASSFRQLLARDPEFIHNVAEQGRRQLPIRSRR